MTTPEYPTDPEIEHQLEEAGHDDAVFGPTGVYDTQSPEQKLSSGLLALAEAAQDQVIAQGEQDVLTATGDEINWVLGEVYTRDPDTNTYFSVSADDDNEHVIFRIRSASPFGYKSTRPEFHTIHDIRLQYDGKTATDDFLSAKSFHGPISTAALEAKNPDAFLAMAASLYRSERTDAQSFKRALGRAEAQNPDQRAGRVTRIASFFARILDSRQ